MPCITIKMGQLEKEKKKELVEELTATAVQVTNIPAESFMVFVEEFPHENVGFGGQTLEERFSKK